MRRGWRSKRASADGVESSNDAQASESVFKLLPLLAGFLWMAAAEEAQFSGTSKGEWPSHGGDLLSAMPVCAYCDAGPEISFRYELLDAGWRLRATEQVRGTDHDQDNIWIFERR